MIPINDIKISPRLLENHLLEKFNYINEHIHNTSFWHFIAGKKNCTHQYKFSNKYENSVWENHIF
jgi:hypothetical protein